MTKHEKEVEQLKKQIKYLEGVIEGMARAAISHPPLMHAPIFQQPVMPTPVYPYMPPYTVTC
jgi:hypothetical protein